MCSGWPEVVPIAVTRSVDEYGTESVSLSSGDWPAFTAIRGDLMARPLKPWMRVTPSLVIFSLENGTATYLIVDHDPDTDETLCALENAF